MFQPNYAESLRSIILSFENEHLSSFTTEEYIDEIIKIFRIRRCGNLRTFIFACQKTIDIYERVKDILPKERLEGIFYSLIAFSTRIKTGVFPDWDGTENLSISLSVGDVPLYRFCYDYIRWQKLDISRVPYALEEHRNKEIYDHHGYGYDPDFLIIDSFHIHTELEVRTALSNMENKLNEEDGFPYFGYRKLTQRLIQLNTILGFDYSICKDRMIKNIRGKSKMIDGELLFLSAGEEFEGTEKAQYEEFKEKILEALNYNNEHSGLSFSYDPSELTVFCNQIIENRDEYISSRRFFSRFDCEKLYDMIIQCTADQIDDFRGVLWAMYRHARQNDYDESEIQSMASFLKRFEGGEETISSDGIIRYQISLLVNDMRRHIEQIS